MAADVNEKKTEAAKDGFFIVPIFVILPLFGRKKGWKRLKAKKARKKVFKVPVKNFLFS